MAQFEFDSSAIGHNRKVYESTCQWRGEKSFLNDAYGFEYFTRLMNVLIPRNFEKQVPILDKCGKTFFHNRANVKYCCANCRVKHYQLRKFSDMLYKAFGNSDVHYFLTSKKLSLDEIQNKNREYELLVQEAFEENPKLKKEAYRYFHFASRFCNKEHIL